GKVMAEFVVAQSGEVIMDTFSIVTSTHPTLTEAVRRAVKDQRFIPASKEGKAVQQVVQQPFNFVPDSSLIRRTR
ncbi:MAG: energy transducer TonB, partial [Gemmatimonadaceae bacterium]